MRVEDPAAFGKVAVVMGGNSAEREVSLDSGKNVLAALQRKGVQAERVDGIPDLISALQQRRFDRVFNIMHGRGGEDGVLQGALEALGVPYTGSGVLGSALSMDKIRTKRVWQAHGLPTPQFLAYANGQSMDELVARAVFPAVVKPSREGSSVGIARVDDERALIKALEGARQYDSELLVESFIEGEELTVGILQDRALPSIRIVSASGFYDYHAKYVAEDTQYICPGVPLAHEAELGTLALAAFRAVHAEAWGRVDLMRDAVGKFWLLEVNTTPGMTSHSLVPKAAAKMGMDFDALCWRILETSFRGSHARD